ncbi:MAG: hypothetical protein H0U67_05190 [Gemmatimonadetes bacterium]|nr:hypothetical protein [Gemmatimonadota bacterium]
MTSLHGLIQCWRWGSTVLVLALCGCSLAQRSSSTHETTPPAAAFEYESGAGERYAAAIRNLAQDLVGQAALYRVSDLSRRSLTHRRLWNILGPVMDSAAGLRREEIGRSVQGRPLYAIHFGRGPVRVVLWSQMHGNEPTATLALVDLLRYVVENPDDALVRRLGERLTVIAIPMLNPDGAERNRRENAAGIDINRDARNQASPEARALALVHARWSPRFGFNLHDQGLRIGADGSTVAISLLAPPHDPQQSDRATFTRAKQIAAIMRTAADSLVKGRVTRYDDTYNPHAFGDAMQSWGTSTVLIETGAWENDSDKEYLRQVNFALLLTALDAIATGSYALADLHEYESLLGSRGAANRR